MTGLPSINIGDKLYSCESEGYRHTSHVSGFAECPDGRIFVLAPESYLALEETEELFIRTEDLDFVRINNRSSLQPQIDKVLQGCLLGCFCLKDTIRINDSIDTSKVFQEMSTGTTVQFEGKAGDEIPECYVSNPECWARLDGVVRYQGLARIRTDVKEGQSTSALFTSIIGRRCFDEYGPVGIAIAVDQPNAIIYLLPYSFLLERLNGEVLNFATSSVLLNHNDNIDKRASKKYTDMSIEDTMNALSEGLGPIPNVEALIERLFSDGRPENVKADILSKIGGVESYLDSFKGTLNKGTPTEVYQVSLKVFINSYADSLGPRQYG